MKPRLRASRRHLIGAGVMILLMTAFSSCSNFQKQKTGAELRKEGYDMLVKTIKPGMYRRQLYAVLPPYITPIAKPPTIHSVFYTDSGATYVFMPHQETHEMDEECMIIVQYQLRSGAEYLKRGASLDPLDLRARPTKWSDVGSDGVLNYPSGISPYRESEMPSKENPDDIIVSLSSLHTKSHPGGKHPKVLLASPTQKHGEVFGRATPPTSTMEFPFPMDASR